jgi:hypothetical protein
MPCQWCRYIARNTNFGHLFLQQIILIYVYEMTDDHDDHALADTTIFFWYVCQYLSIKYRTMYFSCPRLRLLSTVYQILSRPDTYMLLASALTGAP